MFLLNWLNWFHELRFGCNLDIKSPSPPTASLELWFKNNQIVFLSALNNVGILPLIFSSQS